MMWKDWTDSAERRVAAVQVIHSVFNQVLKSLEKELGLKSEHIFHLGRTIGKMEGCNNQVNNLVDHSGRLRVKLLLKLLECTCDQRFDCYVVDTCAEQRHKAV